MSQISSSSGDGQWNTAGEPSRLVLRVYTYYRLLLSICLLYVYAYIPDQHFLGELYPALFQKLVFTYFLANSGLALACLIAPRSLVVGRLTVFVIFCADISFFGLLMYSSGGINSVLGNFLMVPVAFAGAMMLGRVALAVAAIATMVCLFQEVYLHLSFDRNSTDNLVQAGILGITFFIINILSYIIIQLSTQPGDVIT